MSEPTLVNLNKDWKQARPHVSQGDDTLTFGGYQKYKIEDGEITPHDTANGLIKKSSIIKPHLSSLVTEDMSVLDLGCANFYFGLLARRLGAREVLGVDVDKEYIRNIKVLLTALDDDAVSVVEKNVMDVVGEYDLVFALAIIHWIYSCSALGGSLDNVVKHLADRTKKHLFVEWISPDDLAIRSFGHLDYNKELVSGKYDKKIFVKALENNFATVESIGETSSHREVFLCSKKFLEPDDVSVVRDTFSGEVTINKTTRLVTKRYVHESKHRHIPDSMWHHAESCFNRELKWMDVLKDFDRVPTLRGALHKEMTVIMDYMGEPLTKENVPSDWREQVQYILQRLKEYGCAHNDIKPADLLVLDGKINLIDFGWALGIDEKVPKSWPHCLGEEFRIGVHDFDDEYSLIKSIVSVVN
jgi:tRNA A-37 threonylcarbamoyl transferase component Bud32